MSRKEREYHFIYKTTNLLTNRYYYGMHSTDSLEDDYLGSGKRLRYSIRKYGRENHQREIIEFCKNREELKNREKEIINLNEIAKKDCMNLMVGGNGGFVSIEACRKGAKRMNEIIWKDEKFVKRAKERCSKMYDEDKGWRGGRPGKGWHHTSEAKEKMKIQRFGEKNSQYGKCWIHKDNIGKSIKKENLENWLSQGWQKGRTNEFKIAVSKKMKNNKNGKKKRNV